MVVMNVVTACGMPDDATLIRPTGRSHGRPDKAFTPPSGKGAYLNDIHFIVQALNGLLEEHAYLVKHRRVGLVARDFHHIFQFINLADHLFQTLVIVDQ